MEFEGRIGEVKGGQGAIQTVRLSPYGSQAVATAHGQYLESARVNRLFSTMIKGVTILATHNTPIAAATATPVIGVLNPVGNSKAMALVRVAFGTTSGTPAGGQVVLNVISGLGASVTAATTGSIFSHILQSGASPQGSTMRPYNNIALTGLTPAVANELSLVGIATAAAAAGNAGPGISGEDLGGQVIVPPNTLIAIMAGTGAGTTWIVNASLTWEEIDWPL